VRAPTTVAPGPHIPVFDAVYSFCGIVRVITGMASS